jgi:hypothetical protein
MIVAAMPSSNSVLNSIPRPSRPPATTFPPQPHKLSSLAFSLQTAPQCFQQNTASFFTHLAPPNPFLSTLSILFCAKQGGRGLSASKLRCAQKGETIIQSYLRAIRVRRGGLHHAATPPRHRLRRRFWRLERGPKTQARPRRGYFD